MQINDEKYNELLDHLNKIFAITKKQKISKFLGFFSMACGGLVLVYMFYFGQNMLSDALQVTLIVLSLWLWGYGFFAVISMRAVYSLYYPTISLLLIASLPAIAAAITYKFEEWIEILSVCLSSVASMTIFAIFLWQTFTKPEQAKQKFIADHSADILEDYINKESNNGQIKILKSKSENFAIIVPMNNMQCVAVYKNNIDNMELFCKCTFVEKHSAKYYAYKKLLSLY